MHVVSSERSRRASRRGRYPALIGLMLIIGTALALALTVRSGTAHAEPECANPPAGAVVATAPSTVEVRFSQEVDPALTNLTVIAPDGTQADNGDTQVDLYDPERKRVTVSLKPGLGPGTYTVRWHSVSATDQDAVDGSFTFTVAEQGTPAPASPGPGASLAASPTVGASPAATPVAACG